MGLLEVVIALSVMAVAMVGFMAFMKNSSRGVASLTQSNDFDSLVTTVKMVLANPTTCPAALQTVSGAPVAPSAVPTTGTPGLTAPIAIHKISIGGFTLDKTIPYAGLKVTDLKLEQLTAGNPNPVSPMPYVMNLVLTGTKPSDSGTQAVGGGVLSKKIPISVTIVNPGAQAIISCSTVGTGTASSSSVWMLFPPGGSEVTNYMAWPMGAPMSTPQAYCVSQGYARATSRCRFNNGTFEAEGTIAANTWLGHWSWSCNYGNHAWYANPTNTYMECTN